MMKSDRLHLRTCVSNKLCTGEAFQQLFSLWNITNKRSTQRIRDINN